MRGAVDGVVVFAVGRRRVSVGRGLRAVMALLILMSGVRALAQESSPATRESTTEATPADQNTQPPEKRSPWMAVPLVSSNPKLCTSVGVLGAYITAFDPESGARSSDSGLEDAACLQRQAT